MGKESQYGQPKRGMETVVSDGEKFYRYVPQDEGDHLADSKQVSGAKSGAQLDSDNRVNGAGVFEEVDPSDWIDEGYRRRAFEESSSEFEEANDTNDIAGLIGMAAIGIALWHFAPQIAEAAKAARNAIGSIFNRGRSHEVVVAESAKPKEPEQAVYEGPKRAVEMTMEEYNRRKAAAIASAFYAKTEAEILSTAKIVDGLGADAKVLDSTQAIESAMALAESHPELLEAGSEEDFEKAIFLRLESSRGQYAFETYGLLPGVDPIGPDADIVAGAIGTRDAGIQVGESLVAKNDGNAETLGRQSLGESIPVRRC